MARNIAYIAKQLYIGEASMLQKDEHGKIVVENRKVAKDLGVGHRGTDKYMKPLGFELRMKEVTASDGQKYIIQEWVLIA